MKVLLLENNFELRSIYYNFLAREMGIDVSVKPSKEGIYDLILVGKEYELGKDLRLKANIYSLVERNEVKRIDINLLNVKELKSWISENFSSQFQEKVSVKSEKYKKIKRSILVKISKKSKYNLFVDVNGLIEQVVSKDDPRYFDKLENIYSRVDYFHLESMEFIKCIQESFWNILESFDQSNELSFSSNINYLKDAIYLCYELIHILGINESIESLYKLIIEKIISLARSVDDYKEFIKEFRSFSEYNLEHVLGISFMSVKVLDKLNASSSDIAFYLLSVLLHDCGFKDSSIAYFYDVRPDLAEVNSIQLNNKINEIDFIVMALEKSSLNDEQLKSLLLSYHESNKNFDDDFLTLCNKIFNAVHCLYSEWYQKDCNLSCLEVILYQLSIKFPRGFENEIIQTLEEELL